ncbi:hypothetical protein NW759_006323 [Fusarium solani]|nr:hypothetical protein NW759_006323 [Fusarium solani]
MIIASSPNGLTGPWPEQLPSKRHQHTIPSPASPGVDYRLRRNCKCLDSSDRAARLSVFLGCGGNTLGQPSLSGFRFVSRVGGDKSMFCAAFCICFWFRGLVSLR